MPKKSVMPVVPMITHGLPGVGGVCKFQHSDFFVEEIPVQPPGKKGSHVYFFMEKKGITTAEALGMIARAIGKRSRDIGYAGLKDAHAVTRQWISIDRVPPDRVLRLKWPNIRILAWGRHNERLKIGRLQGNRFSIRLRELRCPVAQAVKQTEEILGVLCERGMPNAFGPQRFGNRGNSHLLGKAVLLDQRELFMDLLMGDPRPEDNPNDFRVRSLYCRNQFTRALKTCPEHLVDTRRILRALTQHRGDKSKAFSFVAPGLIRFLVSAYQSYLFNQVLSARMPQIDQLMAGDIACQHLGGTYFDVKGDTLEQDQIRCKKFEISPTGPIYSFDMPQPHGLAGRIESKILNQEQVSQLTQTAYMKKHMSKGERRPLRVQPTHACVTSGRDKKGSYLELKFDLPSGCYATVLLQEVMK